MSQKPASPLLTSKGITFAERVAAFFSYGKFLMLTFSFVLLKLSVTPEFAAACSSCYTPRGKEMQAFYMSTAAMILVPWSIMAGVAYWIYRAYRKNAESEPSTETEL